MTLKKNRKHKKKFLPNLLLITLTLLKIIKTDGTRRVELPLLGHSPVCGRYTKYTTGGLEPTLPRLKADALPFCYVVAMGRTRPFPLRVND
jgi:hypothetical protein